MNRVRLGVAAVFLLGSVGMGASCRNNRNGSSVQQEADGGTGARPARDGSPGPAVAPPSGLVTEVQGVDLTPLSSAERETFWAVANEELSTCGDPHSLAVCARDRMACRTCLPAMRFLARRVQDGMRREDLSESLRGRYGTTTVQQIRTEGAPSHGSVTAPVTIVEFSDYECPHCAHAVPVLRAVEREFEGRVRMVHMNFPLSGHIHAMPAAKAALAAGRQNKFWEMNDLLFTNRDHLEPADLDRYATQLGLNLQQFHTDMASPAVEAAIAATRREGERLQIQGTPSIFINGRAYNLQVERAQLREWIQDEIDLVNQH